jgi:DNA-binding phage protein
MADVTPVEGYGPQLQRAADYVRDCLELYKKALTARNRVIVEAVDNGYAGHQAARDTGLKQPHIIRIISLSEPDLMTRDDIVPGA